MLPQKKWDKAMTTTLSLVSVVLNVLRLKRF